MTRDEVMALTDDSLWWKVLRCLHGDKVLGGYSVHKQSGRAWTQIDGDKIWRENSDYLKDIAMAWELVEFMGFKKGLDLELCGGPLLWEASFAPVDGEVIGFSRANIAPLAIARAFILAMEADGTT